MMYNPLLHFNSRLELQLISNKMEHFSYKGMHNINKHHPILSNCIISYAQRMYQGLLNKGQEG